MTGTRKPEGILNRDRAGERARPREPERPGGNARHGPALRCSWDVFGAAERTRTSTSVRKLAPEASASTNSATAATLSGEKSSPTIRALTGQMVRLRGLEPPRGFPHSALNAARLPIPPQPQDSADRGPRLGAAVIAVCAKRATEICAEKRLDAAWRRGSPCAGPMG